ncbi:MAG: DUF6992 family protein [Propionibacteriaceae bacterium]
MDAWERQRALARTTVVWAAGSIGVGAILASRRDRWWRAFGQQHLGWGVVDLGIVAVVNAYQTRRMRRLPDPYAPEPLERQRRHLRAILVANAAADAGYCALGAVMVHRMSERPRAAGAGVAIVIQGMFLLLHDSHHAWALRPGSR